VVSQKKSASDSPPILGVILPFLRADFSGNTHQQRKDNRSKLKPDLAEANAVKADLLLLDAGIKSDPAARVPIANDSVKNFERAFAINPMLRDNETENFGKAKSLAQL
jgi:hypothetical protein